MVPYELILLFFSGNRFKCLPRDKCPDQILFDAILLPTGRANDVNVLALTAPASTRSLVNPGKSSSSAFTAPPSAA
jgi:hypothetical protein